MRLVFDLDGCCIANRQATFLAYKAAGVMDPPKDWFYKSGWATEEQRLVKNRLYPSLLRKRGKILPAGRILLQTGGIILSGCSRDSLEIVLSAFPQFARPDIACLCEYSMEQKLEFLKREKPGVYFDDWTTMVERVKGETQWQVVNTSRF